MTPSKATGNEVLAYCSSCKMDLYAVVVAKIGTEIVKVQCKTCKKERAYKAPKGVKAPDMEAAAATTEKKASKKAALKEDTKSIQAEWQTLMEAAKGAKRIKYSPRTALEVGYIVDHPNFGEGIVMKLLYPNKAEVIFRDEMRVMIHSR